MSSQAYARRVQAQAIAVPQPRTFAVTGLGLEGWRPFGIAAAAAVLVSVLFVEWTANRWINDEATIALDDIGEAVAALIAAGSCALAATRNTGRTRWAWSFFAASAFSWALGEVVWSYFEVGRGIEVPFPSAADAGYLLAIPFALLGVFAFTSAPTRLATRSETALAGSIVALSLLFIAWAFGLGKVYESSSATPAAQVIGLAYPVGDIVIATVLVVALRRARRAEVGRLALLLWQVSLWDSLTVGLLPGSEYRRSLRHLPCCWQLAAWPSCLRRMRRSV